MTDQDNFSQGIFQGEVLARLKTIEVTCEQIRLLLQGLDARLRVVEMEQEGYLIVRTKSEEHEKRLRAIEDTQTRIKAYAAALGAVVGAIAGFFGSFIKRLW